MKILDFFRRRKKKEERSTIETSDIEKKETNMNQPTQIDPIQALSQNIGTMDVKMKTYDILVFDIDPDTGAQKQTPVNGVKASSPQELVALYASCDQKIRILKEYGGEEPPPPPQPRPTEQVKKVEEPKNTTVVEDKIDEIIKKPSKHVDRKPYFFEVGGIKCKMENGHVYQEQWCRVDSSKYRLISDVNNKEIAMTGKHLETLKWVLIEENNVEETLDNGQD